MAQSEYQALFVAAFKGYLGDNEGAWKEYDATALVTHGYAGKHAILVDVGTADSNLLNQLMPEKFDEAAKKAGVKVRLRLWRAHHRLMNQSAEKLDSHVGDDHICVYAGKHPVARWLRSRLLFYSHLR